MLTEEFSRADESRPLALYGLSEEDGPNSKSGLSSSKGNCCPDAL